MRLEPIDAEYNLAREVLAHITSNRQLQTAVSHTGTNKQLNTHHTITLEAFPIRYCDSQSSVCLGLQLQAVHCGLQDKRVHCGTVHEAVDIL